jgi:parvulin-like peptidyl-prolyl isomerase
VLLELGDQRVLLSEFERHLATLEAQGDATLTADVREALLEAFLEERVLVLEARRQELLGPESTDEEEQAAVRKLLAISALQAVAVSEEDVDAYYEAHRDEFRIPESVTLRQVLVPTLNEARDLRRRLLKDPRSFGSLARSQSRSPEGAEGGLMGTFSRGQLPPELERAAFSLRPGATSGVIETPLGYHVLRVDARLEPRERSLEECRDEIRAQLIRRESGRRERDFVRELLARAQVNHEAAQAPSRDDR